MLANVHFHVRYTGKEAHASAYPELGINAADALTVAQVAIGLLRQHIRPTDRVHGIITKGGEAPNIIPALTTARYVVRARTLDDLDDIRTKVLRCFEAGALATGAHLEIFGSRPPYAQCRGAGSCLSRRGRGRAAQRWLDRHGERVVSPALYPSCDWHQLTTGSQPSAGVHGALHHGRR
jgi:acetylornithine deacetylase/succinyl-diaminopimelate desuccinylase-like protein